MGWSQKVYVFQNFEYFVKNTSFECNMQDHTERQKTCDKLTKPLYIDWVNQFNGKLARLITVHSQNATWHPRRAFSRQQKHCETCVAQRALAVQSQ